MGETIATHHGRPMDPHANELNNRLDWWLRELGRFPMIEEVLALRDDNPADERIAA